MSRNLFPPLIAAIIGVGTGMYTSTQLQMKLLMSNAGIYTFQPIWQEYQQRDREQKLKQEADIGPNMVEIPVQHPSKLQEKDVSASAGNNKKSGS